MDPQEKQSGHRMRAPRLVVPFRVSLIWSELGCCVDSLGGPDPLVASQWPAISGQVSTGAAENAEMDR